MPPLDQPIIHPASGPERREPSGRPYWPGFQLLAFYHHGPVHSCEDAARARGVRLAQELKTIILKAEGRFVAVHLRGDRKLASREIKKTLGVRKLRFAAAEELSVHGLATGLVNPGNTAFCSPHLISCCVFDEPFLTTNCGTRTEGVAFPPRDLLTLPTSLTGAFSHD